MVKKNKSAAPKKTRRKKQVRPVPHDAEILRFSTPTKPPWACPATALAAGEAGGSARSQARPGVAVSPHDAAQVDRRGLGSRCDDRGVAGSGDKRELKKITVAQILFRLNSIPVQLGLHRLHLPGGSASKKSLVPTPFKVTGGAYCFSSSTLTYAITGFVSSCDGRSKFSPSNL